MKRALLIILALAVASVAAMAQDVTTEKAQVDSTYAGRPAVDSTLAGQNIFKVLGSNAGPVSREGKVVIDQTQALSSAMNSHIARNSGKRMVGYRVRIFFDNSKDARTRSENIAGGFKAQHPGIAVYREYENPYFKVTVGDFRTKEDARRFLAGIKGAYPSGFIVREKINYPIM
jgi:opacity protein-like surface antigen